MNNTLKTKMANFYAKFPHLWNDLKNGFLSMEKNGQPFYGQRTINIYLDKGKYTIDYYMNGELEDRNEGRTLFDAAAHIYNAWTTQVVEAHRDPTPSEIKRGYGATHYRSFFLCDFLKPDGVTRKARMKADDGLFYSLS